MMFLNKLVLFTLAAIIVAFTGGCGGRQTAEPVGEENEAEIDGAGNRIFGEVSDTAAVLSGEIAIEGLGNFSFDPQAVETVRDDI